MRKNDDKEIQDDNKITKNPYGSNLTSIKHLNDKKTAPNIEN